MKKGRKKEQSKYCASNFIKKKKEKLCFVFLYFLFFFYYMYFGVTANKIIQKNTSLKKDIQCEKSVQVKKWF